MSFVDEDREMHEDFDDRPVLCVDCGVYYSPDDGDFVSTARGPLCRHCAEPSEAAA
jgi:hypothetical protein